MENIAPVLPDCVLPITSCAIIVLSIKFLYIILPICF